MHVPVGLETAEEEDVALVSPHCVRPAATRLLVAFHIQQVPLQCAQIQIAEFVVVDVLAGVRLASFVGTTPKDVLKN